MSPIAPALVWLRDDLRLDDNPALGAALASGRPIVLLHVLDEVSPGIRPLGGAARWWLHHSLTALGHDVAARGGRLILRRGPAGIVVPAVAEACGAAEIHWNRRIPAAERAVDGEVKQTLRMQGRTATSHRGNLLHEPWRLLTGAGGPFKVFGPFRRALTAAIEPRTPVEAPARLPGFTGPLDGDALDAWGLTPRAPDWSGGLAATWTPGEAGARQRLEAFLNKGIYSYLDERDRPDREATSRLSAHLRFGEISIDRVRAAIDAIAAAADPRLAGQIDKFRAELGWREFVQHQLFHAPDLATRNVQPRFDALPWRDDAAFVAAWRAGRTGYPLVDAGMRELWATGTMHNRVRMVAASFLAKHGLVDWRVGEAWFWDTLVDACPAANPANWQWVAGTGADAAPYFRIFNPVTQSTTFDPDGVYLRRWLPELADLPAKAIHTPWTTGRARSTGYPTPIVEHAAARVRALAAFATLGTREAPR